MFEAAAAAHCPRAAAVGREAGAAARPGRWESESGSWGRGRAVGRGPEGPGRRGPGPRRGRGGGRGGGGRARSGLVPGPPALQASSGRGGAGAASAGRDRPGAPGARGSHYVTHTPSVQPGQQPARGADVPGFLRDRGDGPGSRGTQGQAAGRAGRRPSRFRAALAANTAKWTCAPALGALL